MKPSMPVHRGVPRTLCVTLAPPEPQWQEHGFGSWAIRDKRHDSFLGCAELRFAGEGIEGIAADEVEAGWWVTEERRNEGIATEAMEAAIDDSELHRRSDDYGLGRRTGRTNHSSASRPSLRLAVEGWGRGRSGEPATVYTLCRDDWLRRLKRRRRRSACPSVRECLLKDDEPPPPRKALT